MNTIFMLLAEYEKPIVPLEEVCVKYFGLSKHTALVRARAATLPIPTFRLGETQKNPWFIHLNDLAKLIDDKAKEAHDEFIGC